MDLQKYYSTLKNSNTIAVNGKVTKVVGLVTEANGPASRLGSICEIYQVGNNEKISAEVLGFRDDKILLMPHEEIRGIKPGSKVIEKQSNATIPVGQNLLGRVIDGLGNPIDGKGPIICKESYPLYSNPMNPLLRKRIDEPIDTGIRAISGLLTIGCGQRIGIFAGSGVGKSVMLGMIARKTSADVNVIGLIGERGREVNEFIEKDLGEDGLKRSVVIVATSDHLPLIRMRGAFIATAIAEYFRDRDFNVMLMMDSITRFATAQREIGLATGEPPTSKGFTPSVFTLLPKLLERAGTSNKKGTITGLYTVLVEGDDMNEPVADAVRSILDGHIVLSRELAAQNHYPAIDILNSISRVMEDIISNEHKESVRQFKRILAIYKKAEDLINIGAYNSGSNAEIDNAIKMRDKLNDYLCQDINEHINYDESIKQIIKLFK